MKEDRGKVVILNNVKMRKPMCVSSPTFTKALDSLIEDGSTDVTHNSILEPWES